MSEITISKGHYDFLKEKASQMLELSKMYKSDPEDLESIIKFLHENA